MSLLVSIVIGLVVGYAGGKLVNKTGEGVFVDMILGTVGATAGRALCATLARPDVAGLNLAGIVAAIVGAALVLTLYHTILREQGRRQLKPVRPARRAVKPRHR